MPRIRFDDGYDRNDFIDGERQYRRRERREWAAAPKRARRPDGSESFKCGQCRAFVGPTVFGGRHRNHCPLCLCSRHVDRSHPGDRLSDCRSLMAAVGTFHRADGEQMLVHRCLGCGTERHNRVAADDNPLACLRLPPVAPRPGLRGKTTRPTQSEEDAIAS